MLRSVAIGRDKNARLIQSWSEIAAAIHYQDLSPDRQAEARNEFFQIVIRPGLPSLNPAELAAARDEFEREVRAATHAPAAEHDNHPKALQPVS